MIDFWIDGEAKTKGSGKAVRRGRKIYVVNDCDKAKAFQHWVSWCARQEMAGREPLSGAVEVLLEIFRRRPLKQLDKHGAAKLGAPSWCSTRPDLDKQIRLVLDGLTGICYRDDGQVANLRASKSYTTDEPCVRVAVRELELPAKEIA
jgi:crossover junction endodeoxyribonuclease RusA